MCGKQQLEQVAGDCFCARGRRDLCCIRTLLLKGASEPLTAPTQKFNSFRRAPVCFYPGSATSLQGHGANACNGATP